MSISPEKLSELLSLYQRMSAYTLASPATLQGCMMARPIGGAVSNAFILPRSVAYAQPLSISCVSASNTSANGSGNATKNASASSKEQTQTVAATRQSSGAERRDLPSTSTSHDADQVEVQMLVFEGENIPAFDIGGERRLFMPMLLRRLLQRGFNDCAIRTACEELKIHLQEASNDQVDALRRALDIDVPRCGLIKRSDAERLWSLLEESNAGEKQPDADLKFSPAPSSEQLASHAPSTCSPVGSDCPSERFGDLPTANSFKVYHACFGKQKGVFVPEWYTAPDARCVVCVRCGAQCSPERFVTHVHRATAENNVAHWGFDPAKWRAYLLLAKDQRTSKELRDYFESLKCKFDASRKRKVCSVALAHAQPAVTGTSTAASRANLLAVAGDTRASSEVVKKPRLVINGTEKPLTTPIRPLPQADFHEVPANFTLPAESVTIAQAALASARATSSASSGDCTRTTSASSQQPIVFDSALSTVFVRELQAPQEAQEAELKTIRELVQGRVLSDTEKNDFLADATAQRRRQLALLSGVMYENVLLKQQLKTTKESSEKALSAFAAENNVLRSERRKMEDELERCRDECVRLREELDDHCSMNIAAHLYSAKPQTCDSRGQRTANACTPQTDGHGQETNCSLECCTSVSTSEQDGEDEQHAIDVVRFEDISTDEDSPALAADEGETKSRSANGIGS